MVDFKLQQVSLPQDGPPPAGTPTIYCDGVANLANTPQITKMYLYRADPFAVDTNQAQAQICAQVVMPLASLMNMFIFLESAVSTLVEQGLVLPEQLDALRNAQHLSGR